MGKCGRALSTGKPCPDHPVDRVGRYAEAIHAAGPLEVNGIESVAKGAMAVADEEHTEIVKRSDRIAESLALTERENRRLTSALERVFESMEGPGRSGDEYAYEWLFETWKEVVPLDIRKSVGDTLTTEGQDG